MRIIVVGGGVIGLLTALECSLAGAEVSVVDRGAIPNPEATSYDRHRVLRALHPGAAEAAAAIEAHHRWAEVESRLGTPVYHRVGALTVLGPQEPEASAAAFAELPGARRLSVGETAERFPQLRLPRGSRAVLERDGGVLLADRILAGTAEVLAARPGVRLLPHHRVTGVEAAFGLVRLADGSVLRADAVVVAAGLWSRELLGPDLSGGLTLYRQTQLMCAVPASAREVWQRTPAVPSFGTAEGAWLVPPVGGAPLKLSAAVACRPVERTGDRVAPREVQTRLVLHFTSLLNGFRAEWIERAEDSYYLADRKTHGAVLGQLGDNNAWIYAACGGSSFKFAPMIARSLAGRALGTGPRVPTGLRAVDHPVRMPGELSVPESRWSSPATGVRRSAPHSPDAPATSPHHSTTGVAP
ncbi:FAD-dependent oxidoreductase [Streptomyces sp. NPDC005281]|uniref:FAD-dependent oxidoreductase n=1 Tax=Streptomyces sp. NPDC005281 TaxID=3155712 RepID=UPI0033ABDA10